MDQELLKLLKQVIYPNFSKDIVTFGFVKQAKENEEIEISLEIPSSNKEVANSLDLHIRELLKHKNKPIIINIKSPPPPEPPKPVTKNIAPNIKHFIMVSSGKGGVGKSTIAVNLALALCLLGKRVGLLDADIYGPNIPRMLDLMEIKPDIDEALKKIIPPSAYGIKVMSMGMMYEEGQSLIWRGPMIMRAIEQMLSDVLWGELEVLIIDMPPGTGDAQLTLAQSVPVSAGIVVTTPQAVALDDTARSIDMFLKLHIPLAGIVENMSGFIAPDGKVYDIFGSGSGEVIASRNSCELLSKIPLDPGIRQGGDLGKPIVYFKQESKPAKEYMNIANKIINFLNNVEANNLRDNKDIQPQ